MQACQITAWVLRCWKLKLYVLVHPGLSDAVTSWLDCTGVQCTLQTERYKVPDKILDHDSKNWENNPVVTVFFNVMLMPLPFLCSPVSATLLLVWGMLRNAQNVCAWINNLIEVLCPTCVFIVVFLIMALRLNSWRACKCTQQQEKKK